MVNMSMNETSSQNFSPHLWTKFNGVVQVIIDERQQAQCCEKKTHTQE
jgi:hypothetical protein